MKCPRCDLEKLMPNKYEGIEVDLCPKCHGAWLDTQELTDIVRIREKKFTKELINEALTSSNQGVPENELNHDLHCPICNKAMRPINYAIQSGIIIDRCTQDHGIWFDHAELEKIQAYREYWQDHVKENEKDLKNLVDHVPASKPDKSPSLLFAAAEFLSKYL